MVRKKYKIKSGNTFWVILGMVAVLALLVIFYSLNSFNADFLKNSESINALVIPKHERALIEINFGNGKKRVFAGDVKNEVYPLETALKSAAENGKFTFQIKNGFIRRLAERGDSRNSWAIYKNDEKVAAHIGELTIARGDRYIFKLER